MALDYYLYIPSMHLRAALVIFSLALVMENAVVGGLLVQGNRTGASRPNLLAAGGVVMNNGTMALRDHFVNVTLGGRVFQVLVDSGSADFWVAGAVPESSPTHYIASVEYNHCMVTGQVNKATLQIEGLTIPKQAYIQQEIDASHPDGHGVLGVGPSQLSSVLATMGVPDGNPPLDRLSTQDEATYISHLLSPRANDDGTTVGKPMSQDNHVLPWIIAGGIVGALLVLFAIAATFIYLRGKRYRLLHGPTPEGLHTAESESVYSHEPKARLKTLVLAGATANSRPHSRNPIERTQYWEAMRPKADVGHVMPTRQEKSFMPSARQSLLRSVVQEDSVTPLNNAAITGRSSPPAVVPRRPAILLVPSTPTVPSASSITPDLSAALLTGTHTTPTNPSDPAAGSLKVPSIPRLVVLRDKPLPNPWEHRMSEMLETPLVDKTLSSPSPDAEPSPAYPDTPDPHTNFRITMPPVPPVVSFSPASSASAELPRVPKADDQSNRGRPLPSLHKTGPMPQHWHVSAFDMARGARKTTSYTRPVVDSSSAVHGRGSMKSSRSATPSSHSGSR